jgi:ribonuclease Z
MGRGREPLKLTFLGTGGATPTKERNVPSTAVQIGARGILVDCGEGTQRQLLHTPVSFMKISDVFITHFHGDHFLGLPALMQTMNLNEREDPLTIHGPRDAEHILGILRNLGYFRPRFPIMVNELADGDAVEVEDFTVSAMTARHNVRTLSYRFREKGRPGRFDKAGALELGVPEGPLFGRLQRGESVEVEGRTITPDMVLGPPRPGRKVVFSGDTAPHRGLVDLARGCDVLIHDATFSDEEEDKAGEFGHSTARQAAMTAKDCGARVLFLSHFSPRYEEEEERLLEEAREVFPGARLAKDLEEFVVTFPDRDPPEVSGQGGDQKTT